MRLILFCLVLCLAGPLVNAQTRPNVILILTDDQGWGDLSLHGNPYVETPRLDGLAKSGAQLTQFYVSPLCAPSRASILTGRYHLRTNVVSVSKGLEIMDTNEVTLGELFRHNRYRTGIFGKWHNGDHYPNRPNDQGFDEFLGFCAGHWSNYFDTRLDHNGKMTQTKGYITDVLTDAALAFMKSSKEQPFFCFVPFNAPHSPFQVPDRYFDKYKRKGLTDEVASIYGMVENVDDNVGRILDYLKSSHLEENTIVIFLSDNGPNGVRFNGGMKGIKGSVHEGGVRVPFFIRWPNQIAPGKVVKSPSSHIDIYPTLTDLCRLKDVPGKAVDGVSLRPLILKGDSEMTAERNIFTHVNFMELPVTPNSGGFRDHTYRFVYEKDAAHLYNLVKDPEESHNLSAVDPARTARYQDTYQDWFKQVTGSLTTDRTTILSKVGVTLPVVEGSLTPGMHFKEGHGWAHDWIATWPGVEDSIYWQVDCSDAGYYAIELEYLVQKAQVGSQISCRIGGNSNQVTVKPAYYANQVKSPDRVKRKEAYEMSEWGKLNLGTFHLSKGVTSVVLKATAVKDVNVAEIKGITIHYVKDH